MATPLKDRLNPAALAALEARFGLPGLASAVGDDNLELTGRAARWASAIAARLPKGADGLHVFIKALAAPLDVDAMVYLVHSRLLMILQGDVADGGDGIYDVDVDADADLDLAVAANLALTERFTAEFSLRPLFACHPDRMLAHLQALAMSTNEHHRRLVSESTRPRLPWAPRQPMLQAIAAPVDELLIMLSNDPALYVRRSVANHLGDIAKDDLDRALALCARVAHPWVQRHALRHPVKQGERRALALLGIDADDTAAVDVVGSVSPSRLRRGADTLIAVEVQNRGETSVSLVVDVVVHYVKKSGATSAKTFKLHGADLPAGHSWSLRKRLSTKDLSTRVHWPGRHDVEVQVNGQRHPLGGFDLI